MHRSRGFTLLELMIVVVVMAILAGVAISAYGNQVRKSRRSQAMQVLNDLALREEKYRTNNAEYADLDVLCNGGSCSALTDTDSSPWYSITASNLTGTSYTLTATPRAGTDQVKDPCGAFSFEYENGTLKKSAAGGNENCL